MWSEGDSLPRTSSGCGLVPDSGSIAASSLFRVPSSALRVPHSAFVVFDLGRIRPILKADGGCIFRKALTRVKFFTMSPRSSEPAPGHHGPEGLDAAYWRE